MEHYIIQTQTQTHKLFSDLVEDNRHDEEVQQEALGDVRTVKVEKDECKEQSEELEARVAEGWAQEFQSSDGRQENVAARGTNKSLDDRCKKWFSTHTSTHTRRDLQTLQVTCNMWYVNPLDSQLLPVTEGEAIVSERAQDDGGVDHVLLEAQEPHIQSLKPHQHGILCNTSKNRKSKNIRLLHNCYLLRIINNITLMTRWTFSKGFFSSIYLSTINFHTEIHSGVFCFVFF